MKRTFTLVVSLLLVIFIGNVTAQAVQDQKGTVPMKTPNSVTYGSDVIINYDLSQNQRSACVSVAFNGWLYAAYTVSSGGLQVAKSVDNGATWTISSTIWGAYIFPKIDIVVTGNTVGTLSVWVGYICYDTFSPTYWYAGYEILDGNLNDIGSDDLDYTNVDFYTDVAISSDYRYPAFGAAPYSIGLLYGKRSSVSDSLIFFTTWDGGTNFNARLIVTATGRYLRNIALNYGITSSWSNGRYFAAWEELPTPGNDRGYIETAHSAPYFDSPFTTPVRVDNLVLYGDDNSKNPSIACMMNTAFDNDSSGLTELVTFDRFYTSTGDLDVVGALNLQATTTSYFTATYIGNSFDNELQSDVNYDPSFNNMLCTYYDSTLQSLAYYYSNAGNYLSWALGISQYNDNFNLAAPHPKVEINPVFSQVANVWNAEAGGGYGMAMFDAEYSTVGIPPAGQNAGALDLKVFPNPCSTAATLSFNLKDGSHVTVNLMNAYGQVVGTILESDFSAGLHSVPVDVSGLQSGCYYFSFTADDARASGKIIVTH